MAALPGNLFTTSRDTATPIIIIRVVIGAIFILEGFLKFVTPETYGAGRFVKIGIPAPEVMAQLVGVVEIVCGGLVLIGLATRLAAIPLMIVMLVALATTKVPILLASGFATAANAARLDVAMLLSAGFLVMVGAGPRAVDALLTRTAKREKEMEPGSDPAMRGAIRT